MFAHSIWCQWLVINVLLVTLQFSRFAVSMHSWLFDDNVTYFNMMTLKLMSLEIIIDTGYPYGIHARKHLFHDTWLQFFSEVKNFISLNSAEIFNLFSWEFHTSFRQHLCIKDFHFIHQGELSLMMRFVKKHLNHLLKTTKQIFIYERIRCWP